ncbi:NADH:flavin oxidoreductase/NADH oxidase, partial [Cylindrobasidium torrendii FP15055 ss-10]
MSSSKLFQPIRVGHVELQHRVVLAPLTRWKATQKTHVPFTAIVKEHYAQRASRPGTLLISEATFISPLASGYDYAPGIWSNEQIAAWKEITNGVHAKGSFIFNQLWALGRTAQPDMLRSDDPALEFLAPSPLGLPQRSEIPREMTREEIKSVISDYATAASNAVHKAGFDGVEVHGASGYLVDQFLQDISNQRTDEYGGRIENRARFALEVIDAIIQEVGAERTAIRLSPWSSFQGMRMTDPKPTFAYLVSRIKERYPNLAYLHVVEPRVDGVQTLEVIPEGWDNDFLRDIWAPLPFIAAGGFTGAAAKEIADSKGNLVAFGRSFIANPDLPSRLEKDIPLATWNRSGFYIPGNVSEGYNDYPFAESVTEGS